VTTLLSPPVRQYPPVARDGNLVSKARALRFGLLAGTVIALALVVHGLATVAGGGSGFSSTSARVAYGLLQMTSGAAMLAGLLLSPRSPRLGVVLVAIGVAAISVAWYWFVIVTIPVGVGLLAVEHFRGRDAPVVERSRDHPPAC